jgi:hypothetical protein
MSNIVNELFTKAFEKARQIDFDPKWSNGTGYFDFASQGDAAPKVGNGKMAASQTPTGRRILIIGTRLGNAVVFQRYDNRDDVFVCNIPPQIKHGFCIFDGALDENNMIKLVGDGITIRNIGDRLDDLYVAIKRNQPI